METVEIIYASRWAMAPQRLKYWCQACDQVAKSASRPNCPRCAVPMRNMGMIWKPGKKGKRFRRYPEGWRDSHWTGHGMEYRTEILGTSRPRAVPWEGAWLWKDGSKMKVKGKIPSARLRGA